MIGGVLACLLLALPASAGAATVTNGGDSGSAGQLRQVIADADAGDTIDFAADVTEVTLTSEIVIDKDLTIVGNGAGATEITSTGMSRLFTIQGSSDVDAAIESLELSGGQAPNGVEGSTSGEINGSPGGFGGAIDNHGTLELVAVALTGNRAGDGGNGATSLGSPGGGANGGAGGAVANDGVLRIAGSTLTDNESGLAGNGGGSMGGPGPSGGAGGGGAIHNSATGEATIEDSTFSDNHAAPGPNGRSAVPVSTAGKQGGWGGAIENLGTMVVEGSTLVENEAGDGGSGAAGSAFGAGTSGGGGGGGGAIASRGGSLEVTNSTFTFNSAGDGGDGGDGFSESGGGGSGGLGGAIVMSSGTLTIAASTIVDNGAGLGGAGGEGAGPGPDGSGGGVAGFPAVRGSIIAFNSGAEENCYQGVDDLGGNLAYPSQDECVGFAVGDPALLPLAQNGGATETMALGPGSAALGVLPAASCLDAGGAPLQVDQRGQPRPAPAGEANCDAGAYESTTATPRPPGPPPPEATSPVRSPIVTLSKKPRKTIKSKTKRAKVRFFFTADVPGATFECRMDKAAFTRCKSPQTYRLKKGRHTFRVRATANGVPGPQTKFAFKVKKAKNRQAG